MPRQALLDWWTRCKPDDGLPEWRDLVAAPDPALMPKLAMHEVHGPDTLIVRYFGTALVELWGSDFTNQDIGKAFQHSKAYKQALRVIHIAATHPCGGMTIGLWTTVKGTSYLRRQTYLPIEPGQNDCPRVISYADHEQHVIDMVEQIGVSDLKQVEWIDIGWGMPDPGTGDQILQKFL